MRRATERPHSVHLGPPAPWSRVLEPARPAHSLLSTPVGDVDLIVHDLQFVDTTELMRCFERLMDLAVVEDCLVEPDDRRLRFLAPDRVSDRLIERIYLDGGLTWCSRHPLEA